MTEPNIAQVAALIGDQTRAQMLIALMGGKALTATELAIEANITPQTASSHLAKLVANELLVVKKQGRHKYFQLSGKDVADILESLLNISSKMEHSKVVTGPQDPELRMARICYDHLAGEFGVSLYNALLKNKIIEDIDNNLLVTSIGTKFFYGVGLDLTELSNKKRPLCKSCLDWSERRHHLAGLLGNWVLTDLLKKGWARKDLDTRVIRFSTVGSSSFKERYGL